MVAYVQPVELFYDGDWHDHTADVRDDIAITEGQGPDTTFAPSSMSCTFDNPDQEFSPLNVSSSLFGKIGLNTPVRVTYRAMFDTFARTVASGWGTAADGRSWTIIGVGTSTASVGSGVAVHTLTIANGYRLEYLTDVDGNRFPDAEIRTKFTPQLSDVTGAAIEPANLVLRMVSVSSYYFLRVSISPAEAISISIRKLVSNVETTLTDITVVAGLTFTGQQLAAAFGVEGDFLYAKVWDPAVGEPLHPQLITADRSHTTGMVGVRTGRASGNTNSSMTVHYDDLQIRIPQFIGEIERWPQRSNEDDSVLWVPIRAFGVSRRMIAAGTRTPARSAPRRAIEGASVQPITYYPLEEGQDSPAPVDVITGASGIVNFAECWQPGRSTTDLAGVKVMRGVTRSPVHPEVPSGATGLGLTLPVATHAATGVEILTLHVRFVPEQEGDIRVETDMYHRLDFTGGNIDFARLLLVHSWSASGAPGADPFINIQVRLYAAGVSVAEVLVGSTSGSAPYIADGGWHEIQIRCVQNGANVDLSLWVDGAQRGSTATATTKTLGSSDNIQLGVEAWKDILATAGESSIDVAFEVGHVTIHTSSSVGDFWDATTGHFGETSWARAERIAGEQGIPFSASFLSGQTMGQQKLQPPFGIILDAATADGAVLREPRSFLGLVWRGYDVVYGQAVALLLTYGTSGHVGHPLNPPDDTAGLVNDVTVTRYRGGQVTVRKDTGRNNTSEPENDPKGVGRYEARTELNVALDLQLLELGARRLREGSWPDTRYAAMALRPDANPTIGDRFHSMLALKPGQRLQIVSPPARYGPGPIDQIVRGRTNDPRDDTWKIGMNTVPAGPFLVKGLSLDGGTNARATCGDPGIGDVDIAIELTVNVLATRDLVHKWGAAGQQSFFLYMDAGVVNVFWTADGTGTDLFATVSDGAVIVAGKRVALRWKLDVNNGAGGRTHTLETAPCIDGPWTVNRVRTDAGTTSIFDSNALLAVGGPGGASGNALNGTIHAVQVRNGINGALIRNARFQEQPPGVTSFTDDAGSTWTLTGTAAIV